MEWTREVPKVPGVYWLRRHWASQGKAWSTTEAVQMDDQRDVWFMGSEMDSPARSVARHGAEPAEWFGPLTPPTDSTAPAPGER